MEPDENGYQDFYDVQTTGRNKERVYYNPSLDTIVFECYDGAFHRGLLSWADIACRNKIRHIELYGEDEGYWIVEKHYGEFAFALSRLGNAETVVFSEEDEFQNVEISEFPDGTPGRLGTFLYNEAKDEFRWMEVRRHSEIPAEELRAGNWELNEGCGSGYLDSCGWEEDFELINGRELLGMWLAYFEREKPGWKAPQFKFGEVLDC